MLVVEGGGGHYGTDSNSGGAIFFGFDIDDKLRVWERNVRENS